MLGFVLCFIGVLSDTKFLCPIRCLSDVTLLASQLSFHVRSLATCGPFVVPSFRIEPHREIRSSLHCCGSDAKNTSNFAKNTLQNETVGAVFPARRKSPLLLAHRRNYCDTPASVSCLFPAKDDDTQLCPSPFGSFHLQVDIVFLVEVFKIKNAKSSLIRCDAVFK